MPTNGLEFELRILKMLLEYAINSRVIQGRAISKVVAGLFLASAGYFLGLLRVYDFFIQFPLARRTSPPNPQ